MKQTPLWNEIRAREEYGELSDDELASEVHARLVGKEGEQLLKQMQQEAFMNGDNATILKRQRVLYKLKEWLKEFWQWVKGTQVSGMENMSLEEFISMPIAELVERSKAREKDEVNKRFNEELEEFKDGRMSSNKKFDLGEPGKILIASGVRGSNITMTQSVLKKHLEKHNIGIDEIKDLVKAINKPMMVYEWGSKAKSIIIMTNIKRENGDKISVAIRVNKEKGELNIDEIVSIHGKEGKRFINDMLNAKEGGIQEALKYVQDNKKEVLDWLAMETPKVSSQTEQELHITKVVQNFENPQEIQEKDEVNKRFNEELQQQIDGTLAKDHTYQLGRPSEILQSAGIPNLPIELKASRLNSKSKQENHPFELSEIKGLVDAIHNPLAVFRSATHIGSNVILTEIRHKGKNFVVAIQTNKKDDKIEINSVRSVHYRQSPTHILNWIEGGLADYIKPTFTQKWLEPLKKELRSQPQYNSTDVRTKLNSVAKIVQNFENPPIEKEKILG